MDGYFEIDQHGLQDLIDWTGMGEQNSFGKPTMTATGSHRTTKREMPTGTGLPAIMPHKGFHFTRGLRTEPTGYRRHRLPVGTLWKTISLTTRRPTRES